MNIKKLREAKGMRKEELAVKVGVSLVTIYNWEKGGKIHRVFEKQLKKILGVDEKAKN